jgi:hypothetical protein
MAEIGKICGDEAGLLSEKRNLGNGYEEMRKDKNSGRWIATLTWFKTRKDSLSVRASSGRPERSLSICPASRSRDELFEVDQRGVAIGRAPHLARAAFAVEPTDAGCGMVKGV